MVLNANESESFGISIDISNELMVIGADNANVDGKDAAGKVYIYENIITDNPTNYPTQNPTIMPTYLTNIPTILTNIPSLITNNPTLMSKNPTNLPTIATKYPTNYPINNPTNTPTNNPSIITQIPTYPILSNHPTLMTKNPTKILITTNSSNHESVIILVIIISYIVTMIILLAVICIIRKSKKRTIKANQLTIRLLNDSSVDNITELEPVKRIRGCNTMIAEELQEHEIDINNVTKGNIDKVAHTKGNPKITHGEIHDIYQKEGFYSLSSTGNQIQNDYIIAQNAQENLVDINNFTHGNMSNSKFITPS